ncbi:hypothetical protein Goshw_022380 [Gossypium schwendimanii]|uniref:Uncharacterized protein n=1 Tax=Gossypium schwendimanii TaxID=34291 RepID=A0A7J9KYN3_GOSSC|nr:hypothetical protein [Gossypium schwendimanii]
METQDTHIPSSMRRVYNHTGGRAITAQVTSGWVDSDGLSFLYRLESCMRPTVEPWAELCGTTEGALRYTTPFRSTTESGENSSMHPVQILGESQHMARRGVIDSLRYDGDKQIRSSSKAILIDLRERTEDGWEKFHEQYINIWEHKYDILLNCEQIIARELAVDPSIQGLEQVPKWVHHRHQHNKRHYCLHHILVSMARLILVQIQIEGKVQKLTIVGATTKEKRQSTSNGVLRGW